MSKEFFPQRPESKPMIYAYEDVNPQYAGLLKIGYTTINVEDRVKQQYPTLRPGGTPYRIVFAEPAIYADGGSFMDHAIHKYLERHGFKRLNGEWFRCTVRDLKAAYIAVRDRTENIENRDWNFSMRPEQADAVYKTKTYFESLKSERKGFASPKFLWNAKMRFGKTFASYQLAKQMGFKRVLILTFKPAVQSAWEEDLSRHVDFEGWQFVSRNGKTYEECDKKKPIVCFGSFQDYLGVDKDTGSIKPKNEWVHAAAWDLVIFDEYHFGAWRDSARKLFDMSSDEFDEDTDNSNQNELLDETWLPITSSYYLYLSGTPFRAINSGEFIEEQVYNWTYSDEQRAKENWKGPDNPYAELPRMVLMTYEIPEAIRRVAMNGEINEFDLNMFFEAKGKGKDARFVFENEVQKWLDLICGDYLDSSITEIKVGTKRGQSFLPFKETALLNVLSHTVWFLPNVASCQAMANLLKQKQNSFYHSYTVNVCAGTEAGVGLEALYPVQDSMKPNPLETKTITLTCGKLTTGVTVKPWTGIFMLRNLKSPETYFQAAFRVQSPWTIKLENGQTEIIKKECYVFDFALNRALKQIADYSTRLNINETNPEKKVEEITNFLPVLAYKDGAMKEIDSKEILDIAMSGTSATLLARRWESALLVNVTDLVLKRLLANQHAMDVLMKIEGFRSLNKDITTIIAKSEDVKQKKKEGKKLTPKEKKQLTDEEKEYKSKRKEVQEKLIKFATRIPIFMYLTDFREYSLKDVITQIEPKLFKKVTGLEVADFELLVSLGIFNGPLMDDAVYKFKRYEDASLEYTGINKHAGEERVGLYDTSLSREEYEQLDSSQQSSMKAPKPIRETFVPKSSEERHEERQHREVRREEPKEEVFVVEKKPITFDRDLVVIGAIVNHKAFGLGKIVDLKDDYVVIKFDAFKDKKMFENPNAFERGFLTLMESSGTKKEKNELVWYVCYGSNLCLERFMCYLTGKGSDKYHIEPNPGHVCSDQTPPRDSKAVIVPYDMYFAKYSEWWNGSIAFLDKDRKGKTYGRAYLISKKQYEHVKQCEGPLYRFEINLDAIDGIPAVTFTNKNRFIDIRRVSSDYRRVIIDGLKEIGIDETEAERYIAERIDKSKFY